MRILLMGQCSLHWGRMEFGNIGNYYIIEPMIRQLHEFFPGSEIVTTLQMSEEFCSRESISVLPMDLYYGWNESDLENAYTELGAATVYNETGYLPIKTPFIEEVLSSDLVIDFSGDIWGDNADFLGSDRFLVGLCKDRVAQLLGKPTVMIAGSPGPFETQSTLAFAKTVYKSFDLVTNREPISINILTDYGFDVSKTHSLACPSFLFEAADQSEIQDIIISEGISKNKRPAVGFILCGWNFKKAPFDKWPRDDDEYLPFVNAIRYLIDKLGVDVYLMSHSNGFPIPPQEFELQHGRDYKVIKQLQDVAIKHGIKENLYSLDGVYDTWQTKALISNFDMLVSGRVHGAIAGLSQAVPTVIIDYGHEPKAHKLEGFAKVVGVEKYIADPNNQENLISTIDDCWGDKKQISEQIKSNLPEIKTLVKENFKQIVEILE